MLDQFRVAAQRALRDYANDLASRRIDVEPASTLHIASWVFNLARCQYGLRVLRPCTKSEAVEWHIADSPDLATALTTALAVRRGESPLDAVERLQSGMRMLQARFSANNSRDRAEDA